MNILMKLDKNDVYTQDGFIQFYSVCYVCSDKSNHWTNCKHDCSNEKHLSFSVAKYNHPFVTKTFPPMFELQGEASMLIWYYNMTSEVKQFRPSYFLTTSTSSIILWIHADDAIKALIEIHICKLSIDGLGQTKIW